jgi:hypothetical protein
VVIEKIRKFSVDFFRHANYNENFGMIKRKAQRSMKPTSDFKRYTVDSRYSTTNISTGFFDPNYKKTFKFITQYKHLSVISIDFFVPDGGAYNGS